MLLVESPPSVVADINTRRLPIALLHPRWRPAFSVPRGGASEYDDDDQYDAEDIDREDLDDDDEILSSPFLESFRAEIHALVSDYRAEVRETLAQLKEDFLARREADDVEDDVELEDDLSEVDEVVERTRVENDDDADDARSFDSDDDDEEDVILEDFDDGQEEEEYVLAKVSYVDEDEEEEEEIAAAPTKKKKNKPSAGSKKKKASDKKKKTSTGKKKTATGKKSKAMNSKKSKPKDKKKATMNKPTKKSNKKKQSSTTSSLPQSNTRVIHTDAPTLVIHASHRKQQLQQTTVRQTIQFLVKASLFSLMAHLAYRILSQSLNHDNRRRR